MDLVEKRRVPRTALRWAAILVVALSSTLPALAQNKKNSWEVFIYFGSFFSQEVPSARQFGEVTTYRVEPGVLGTDPNDVADPGNINHVFTPNLGLVGGDPIGIEPNDPNYRFPIDVDQGTIISVQPCSQNFQPLTGPSDTRAPFFDECDPDMEARYRYNASGISTNGEIQKDSSEFMLGLRGGYNITRHWEVELDVGFGKQRVDLTQNLVPLLTQEISALSPCPSMACDLAAFYQFTWANRDYKQLVPGDAARRPGEHPIVVSSRLANDPRYNILMYFPTSPEASAPPEGPETFADVTGFVNRVFQNPTAFRNRGDQINIDNFTLSGSVLYNFNTKADSRIVPYLQAGFGQWIRNFDTPYDGGDSSFLSYGGGIRFFVNEIFSFRADIRNVSYLDDTFTITAELLEFNLEDEDFPSQGRGCMRDQPAAEVPCSNDGPLPGGMVFPDLGGGGGNAFIEVESELDDFFEFRIGFDVILGGK